jgi:hypothetical protein
VRRIVSLVVLVVLVVLGAGCGSSGFHSATHVYSVHQVEAAFRAHGVELRKAKKQLRKVVVLGGGVGRGRGYVNVYVARIARLAEPFRLIPGLAQSRGPVVARKHGNVVLLFKNNTPAEPLRGALEDLH